MLTYRRVLASGRAEGDGGYALALSALVLIPLLLIAGLAVDLGSWHASGTRIQRAADAAALAGVTFLPKGEAVATERARDVAASNGFVHGANGITVDVAQVSAEQLRVTIRDGSVARYLTGIMSNDPVEIERSSTAEYIMPVPLGSPRNFLGTHRLLGDANAENFWLGISGYCSSKEQGDRITAFSDANWNKFHYQHTTANPVEFQGCDPSGAAIPNAEYRPEGYFYAVHVPEGAGSVDIQAYDLPFCSATPDPAVPQDARPGDIAGFGGGPFTLDWKVRGGGLNPRDAPVLPGGEGSLVGQTTNTGVCADDGTVNSTTRECASKSTTWALCWQTLHTVGPGLYFVQLTPAVPADKNTYQGSNHFALRAKHTSTFSPCSAQADPETCPNVYGLEHLGVYAGRSQAGPAEFYLAEIGQQHGGKTMEVTLWDPGEGAETIQILDPTGQPIGFNWRILCQDGTARPSCPEWAPKGGWSGVATAAGGLDVSGRQFQGPSTPPDWDYQQAGPNRLSDYKYNGRHIRIEIPLPADLDAAYSGQTWWRVRYTTNETTATDRTTWSVIVRGDPVRLVPNR